MSQIEGEGTSVELLHAQFRHRSELHFRRLLDRLPAAAYTCDAAGLITYFNQQAEQVWGRAPKLNDGIDRFCGSFKLFSSEGAPLEHSACWMALALEQNRGFNGQEIIVERPDGMRLTALAHANPIHDEDGRLWGAVNVLVDITEQKRAEAALREADSAKNAFLATLAHELRNPLAPIRNAVEILHQRDTASPEGRAALDVIDRQMRQMVRLVDDLLDVGRITGKKLEIRRSGIELDELLEAAVEVSRPLIEAAGHTFQVRLPARPVYLEGDLSRLAQAISNLLNNAATYTAPGGRIDLIAEKHGDEVEISVLDTGVGIPDAMLPRIFDLFTQGERLAQHSGGSLGVGLTLARQIVELHEGAIDARSDGPGAGSVFTIRLPLSRKPSLVNPQKEEVLPPPIEPSLRVMVVDDNPDIVESTSMLLELGGFAVQTAGDGREAGRVAETFRPDVVLLDIGMPGMSGHETAQMLRGQPGGASRILIAVTGWGQAKDFERSREAGFDHHLVKPADPDALLQLLGSIESRVRGQQSAA